MKPFSSTTQATSQEAISVSTPKKLLESELGKITTTKKTITTPKLEVTPKMKFAFIPQLQYKTDIILKTKPETTSKQRIKEESIFRFKTGEMNIQKQQQQQLQQQLQMQQLITGGGGGVSIGIPEIPPVIKTPPPGKPPIIFPPFTFGGEEPYAPKKTKQRKLKVGYTPSLTAAALGINISARKARRLQKKTFYGGEIRPVIVSTAKRRTKTPLFFRQPRGSKKFVKTLLWGNKGKGVIK